MFDAFVREGDKETPLSGGPFKWRHLATFARLAPDLEFVFRPALRWNVFSLEAGGKHVPIADRLSADELRQLFESLGESEDHRLTEYVIQPA